MLPIWVNIFDLNATFAVNVQRNSDASFTDQQNRCSFTVVCPNSWSLWIIENMAATELSDGFNKHQSWGQRTDQHSLAVQNIPALFLAASPQLQKQDVYITHDSSDFFASKLAAFSTKDLKWIKQNI